VNPNAGVSAVIVAAGRGRRMGGTTPKLLLPVAGRPLLAHTLIAFEHGDAIDEIVVVVPPEPETAEPMAAVARAIVSTTRLRLCSGGPERRDSVLAGVCTATHGIVLIHDGARPCVTPDLVARVVYGVRVSGACVPVVKVRDTIRGVESQRFSTLALPRDTQRVLVQTPQGFLRARIEKALRECHDNLPDEAEALLRRGDVVPVVAGLEENLKLTTPSDIPLIEAILAHRTAAGAYREL
jgi:2-C-methyl-D-erythritol 4-phosphate cytidylyltransferase